MKVTLIIGNSSETKPDNSAVICITSFRSLDIRFTLSDLDRYDVDRYVTFCEDESTTLKFDDGEHKLEISHDMDGFIFKYGNSMSAMEINVPFDDCDCRGIFEQLVDQRRKIEGTYKSLTFDDAKSVYFEPDDCCIAFRVFLNDGTSTKVGICPVTFMPADEWRKLAGVTKFYGENSGRRITVDNETFTVRHPASSPIRLIRLPLKLCRQAFADTANYIDSL